MLLCPVTAHNDSTEPRPRRSEAEPHWEGADFLGWSVRLGLLILGVGKMLCVAIGQGDRQPRFDDAVFLLGEQLTSGSVYRLLAEQGQQLFADD
jgi:hypothetical protein